MHRKGLDITNTWKGHRTEISKPPRWHAIEMASACLPGPIHMRFCSLPFLWRLSTALPAPIGSAGVFFSEKRVVIDLIVLELPEMPSSAIFACLPARPQTPYWGLAYEYS